MKILLVFIKYPEPGRVKTRLARSIGAAPAADLYRRMAEKTVHEAKGVRDAKVWVAYDPPAREAEVRKWLGNGLRYLPQQGDDLGERLAAAFDAAFAAGATHAVAVGSDCPALSAAVLEEAFQMIENRHAAIGPAQDGGYYLLGLRLPAADLFSDVAWSSNRVCLQTTERLHRLGLSYGTLPVLADVDTVLDLTHSPSLQS